MQNYTGFCFCGPSAAQNAAKCCQCCQYSTSRKKGQVWQHFLVLLSIWGCLCSCFRFVAVKFAISGALMRIIFAWGRNNTAQKKKRKEEKKQEVEVEVEKQSQEQPVAARGIASPRDVCAMWEKNVARIFNKFSHVWNRQKEGPLTLLVFLEFSVYFSLIVTVLGKAVPAWGVAWLRVQPDYILLQQQHQA